jgi:hypothetical protein
MLKKIVLLIGVWSCISSGFSQTFAKKEIDIYCNTRFLYSINFPKDILYPQNESGNGDGLRMMSKDAKAILSVYGMNNVMEESLLDKFQEDSAGGTVGNPTKVVSYKIIKDDWFVVSGYDSGIIFYSKTFLIDEQFKTFVFRYPESQRKLYDPVTKLLAKTFDGNISIRSSAKNDSAVLKCK